MTRTEKYNFKISINQHKKEIPHFWEDLQEVGLIDLFEGCCLSLKNKNKEHYTMIELGSNWAYYSLLFKHILGKEKTTCIMIEPIEESLQVGKKNFEINNCLGFFYKRGIGNTMEFFGDQIPIESTTLDNLLSEHSLKEIDILHCDIDTAEICMLDTNESFFKNKRVNNIFILTHGDLLAEQCKQKMTNFSYKLLVEQPYGSQGGDGLLVYKKI